MFRFKIDVFEAMKNSGYNTTRIRRERIVSENALMSIRNGKVPGIHSLDAICNILNCDIGDLIEHIPDREE